MIGQSNLKLSIDLSNTNRNDAIELIEGFMMFHRIERDSLPVAVRPMPGSGEPDDEILRRWAT